MIGINFGSEQANGLAVHRNAPIQNELLAGPAGSHTGVGEKFLQTNHGDWRLPTADLQWKNHPDRAHRKSDIVNRSGFRFRFAETGNAVAFLPLTAFLEERGALETLEDIALATQGGGRAEAAML
jgi:hypothetical protein